MASNSDMEKFADYIIGRGNFGRDKKTMGIISESIIQSYAELLHQNYHRMLLEDTWWFFQMRSYVSHFLDDMEKQPEYWWGILGISCTAEDFNFIELLEVCSRHLAQRLQHYAADHQIRYIILQCGDTGFRYE